MFSDKDKQRILSYFEHKNKPAPAASEIDSLKIDLLEFRGEFEFIDQKNNTLEAENAALKEENETSKSMIQNLASYAEDLEKKFAAQANSHATMVGSMILAGDNNKIGAVSSDISQTINGFSQFRFRQDDGKEFVVMFKVSEVASNEKH